MYRILISLLTFLLFFPSCRKSDSTEPEKFSNAPDIKWVLVEGGTFLMGDTSAKSSSDELPVHKVTLSSYYISKYEITNTQFAEFLNSYKSDTVKSGKYMGKIMVYKHKWGLNKIDGTWLPVPGYENHPVLNVEWYGADEFCKYYGWRLPTEAEWEFAAKGGIKSKGYQYSGSDSLDEVAWYSPLVEDSPGVHSHAVGEKNPNELGIYDMSGNAWEWCQDLYSRYSGIDEINPQGPVAGGKNRIYRGGCWLSLGENCRNTTRSGGSPDYHGVTHNGFRCVITK